MSCREVGRVQSSVLILVGGGFVVEGTTGTPWSAAEIEAVVSDYFEMLALDLAGIHFNKAQRNRNLVEKIGRPRTAIEFKHANISAVLEVLSQPWLRGYAPRRNFQGALLTAVEGFLVARPNIIEETANVDTSQLEEAPSIFFEPPPESFQTHDDLPANVIRLVRKFDPAGRDAANRALGKMGERLVYLAERTRLQSQGRDDLARKVRWVAEEDGDGAGYDIKSFDNAGSERFLEVKTTRGGARTPFFISENERTFSEECSEQFTLIRLYDFSRATRAFELAPPLSDQVNLAPAVWKATFGRPSVIGEDSKST